MPIKELSAKTGISENTLKTYLRKDCAEPTLSKAILIANALDVSLDYLATGKEKSEAFPFPEMASLFHIIRRFSEKDIHILSATAAAIRDTREN